ncbi:MAG: hypothetical protein KA713_16715 [Chryseotalea sp. WA131a]|jgi:hypothetical protein|nr:MAG: hypothetical protein KA713_16715 [Chryseotalea sp. WA131a]
MKIPKIKQRDITDCGAACLASIAAHYELQLPVARRLLRLWTLPLSNMFIAWWSGCERTKRRLSSLPTASARFYEPTKLWCYLKALLLKKGITIN